MKTNILILTVVFLVLPVTFTGMLNAQGKTREDDEREMKMQELINEQKKAMKDLQIDIRKDLQIDEKEIQESVNEAQRQLEELRKEGVFRIYTDKPGTFIGEPFWVSAPDVAVFHSNAGDVNRMSWDFSKSMKDVSFSRDYTFDVEPTDKTVVMSVNGDCKAGEIRIKIIMPDNKVYADIVIDEFGNLNWRKSFTISDTENKDKTGAWEYQVTASKATGYFRISLQTF